MSELAPPRKSVGLEDSGARELDHSENESDVFSDAQEGQGSSSDTNSPIPTTRVEKVDSTESHGEVPGTEAYKMRTQDAVPDELEIVPEGQDSRRGSTQHEPDRTSTPGGTPIPRTVVEKIDPESPSHGDVPGTPAHAIRKADAVTDIIKPASSPEPDSASEPKSASSTEVPVPRMVVTRIDSKPAHGEVPGTEAYEIRKGDAEPDVLEKQADVPDLPTSSLSRSTRLAFGERRPSVEGTSPIAADGGFGPMNYDEDDDGSEKDTKQAAQNPEQEESEADEGFDDDFDEFEAGAGDDDFGEFDEGFQHSPPPQIAQETRGPPEPPAPIPEYPFPLIDFSSLSTLDDLLEATATHLDTIFPSTKNVSPPSPNPTPSTSEPSNPNPIFLTPRSASLWAQLVAPPPLQPPNWVRSRIRRLFLVSLGVPVDLDEILPASKQKKLILPSTLNRTDNPSRGSSDRNRRDGSRGARLKQENSSSVSLDQQISGGVGKSKRRKGPAPPPELDLVATRQLCTTTEAALKGFTDDELKVHVRRLEEATEKAREVLEYWLRRKDAAVGDKEAFEGVIENLVRHARRVRK